MGSWDTVDLLEPARLRPPRLEGRASKRKGAAEDEGGRSEAGAGARNSPWRGAPFSLALPYPERAGLAGRWTPIAGAAARWGVRTAPDLPVCDGGV